MKRTLADLSDHDFAVIKSLVEQRKSRVFIARRLDITPRLVRRAVERILPPRHSDRPWTAGDDAFLLEHAARGARWKAEQLGRSPYAVRLRWDFLQERATMLADPMTPEQAAWILCVSPSFIRSRMSRGELADCGEGLISEADLIAFFRAHMPAVVERQMRVKHQSWRFRDMLRLLVGEASRPPGEG